MTPLVVALLFTVFAFTNAQAKDWFIIAGTKCVAIDNIDVSYGQIGVLYDHSGKFHSPSDLQRFIRNNLHSIVDHEDGSDQDDVVKFRMVIPNAESTFMMLIIAESETVCQYFVNRLLKY